MLRRTMLLGAIAMVISAFTPAPHYVVPTTMIDVIKHLGLETSLQLAYDAGDINSYSGSGEYWEDVSGNNVDAINGTSAGDTTLNWDFVGTPGQQSASNYWDRNNTSGSAFRIPLQSWMSDVHKDGGKITIASWAYSPASYATVNLSTIDAGGLVGGPAYPGFQAATSGGKMAFVSYRADGTQAGGIVSTNTVPSGWTFTAWSIDEQSGTYVMQMNGTQETGAISYTTPAATAASVDMIVLRGGADDHYQNSLAMWNVALAASDLMEIYNATKAKFGL